MSEIVIVPKGWGYEKIFVNKSYCGKLLHFNAGKRCSFHFHRIKDEVFFLHSGLIRLLYSMDDDYCQAKELILQPGDKFEIPIGLRHQMIALEESDLYEFSTTDYPEDSYRIIRGD